MCLDYKLSEDKKQQILDDIPPEGIEVYKVVITRGTEYYPLFMDNIIPYDKGIDNAVKMKIPLGLSNGCNNGYSPLKDEKYTSGFHFFKDRDGAKKLLEFGDRYWRKTYKYEIITCIVKKSWITEIGEEMGFIDGKFTAEFETVIVAEKAIFPRGEEDGKREEV